MKSLVFPIHDDSRVTEVRGAALHIAQEEGLSDSLAGAAGLVATECATNVLKHAKGGEIHVSPLSHRGSPGVEVLAIDAGPGMADTERCLEDGFSSTGTHGSGLGAIRRSSQFFDIYSVPGKGTAVVAQVTEARTGAMIDGDLRVGALKRPLEGQIYCGDDWTICAGGTAVLLMLVDGLGHGMDASQASAAAVDVFRRSQASEPREVLLQIHNGLKSTRGAAVAVTRADFGAGNVVYAGPREHRWDHRESRQVDVDGVAVRNVRTQCAQDSGVHLFAAGKCDRGAAFRRYLRAMEFGKRSGVGALPSLIDRGGALSTRRACTRRREYPGAQEGWQLIMSNGSAILGGLMLSRDSDIVMARQRARQLAEFAGLHPRNQSRLATAVSEVARNAIQYAGGGRLDFSIDLDATPQVLWVDVIDRGPGIVNLQEVLDGAYESRTGMGIGITGTRRLMDHFEAHSERGAGARVRFGKAIPEGAFRLTSADAEALRQKFLALGPVTTHEELERQTKELAYALDSLRTREEEVQQREAELQRLGLELEDTNRGVVALYAELDEKAAALSRADEMKSRILWHVSHEFRTPVGSILALSQLLLRGTDGPLTAEQEKQVGFVRQAAAELAAMVNDLLDLARVESGRTEVKLAPVSVNQFLGLVRGLMRPLLTSETVALVFEECEPDAMIDTDETKLGQIIRNLISNALKFTERGEVRVRCMVETGTVKFIVSDTGIGMAPENLERIFEEFSQLENPIQKHVKGTGLGLPLSRKLAKLLGGTLTVSSRLGVGSEFALALPRASKEDSASHTPPGESIALVIDDEEASRYIAAQLFRGSQFRILEAAGGAEGAERARFEHPSLILLDLIMPDRTGFEVLDELKSNPETASIPIVIHSSMNLTERDLQRLANRHIAVLPKLGGDRLAALTAIREILQDSTLFQAESEFMEAENA